LIVVNKYLDENAQSSTLHPIGRDVAPTKQTPLIAEVDIAATGNVISYGTPAYARSTVTPEEFPPVIVKP